MSRKKGSHKAKVGFGIDIGGSGIKGAPVDLRKGRLVADRLKIETPQPSTPEAIALAVRNLGKTSPEWLAWATNGWFDRADANYEDGVGWHFNPEFRTGPITFARMAGIRIGTKVASKNCGPTDNLMPLDTSAKNG